LQLSFPFQTSSQENLFKEEDFLPLSENSAAVDFCKKFFSQKNFSSSGFQSFVLKGEEASGKSHLLHIFAKKSRAEFIKKEAIEGLNLAELFLQNQFYILENIDEIANEELLLHVINSASEAGAFLALSLKATPQFKLKDLASRFKNIFTVSIKNIGEESSKLLLSSQLSRRQINVSRQIIDHVVRDFDRSYKSVLSAAKYLEFLTSEKGSALKLSDIRKT
jgi:chromosomal replication initiation ATPase DnaA